MKHRFLLFFFALASVWPLNAQKTYRFPMTLTYDMYLNFGERKQYDARLFFSGEAACFTYRPIKDYSHVDEMNPEVDTWKISWADTTLHVVWRDKALDECSELAQWRDETYRLAEPLPAMQWTMEKDTREIEGFRCQKAVCRFRGRNYTAWFTTDIPCGWGPWKFSGLPGAILEAYDDTNEVSFYATGVKPDETTLERPDESGYPALTPKEYVEKVNKGMEALMKRLASRMGEGVQATVSKSRTKSIELEYE